mgnify:CR=1 FL=1
MQFKREKRILAAILSGCMIASCVPQTVRAAKSGQTNANLQTAFSGTADVVDLAAAEVPDSVHLTEVSTTAAASVIRNRVKELVEDTLKDSYFAEDGGSIDVSGEESPYSVELTLGEKVKMKSVSVTVEYADNADMDILKKTMAQILQGEFSFTSAKDVTAQALQQQIDGKLEEGVTATVTWDEGKQYYELTLLKGDENLTSPLYVNSEVSISEFTEEFLQNCTTRKAKGTTIEAGDGAIRVNATQSMSYENIVLPVFNYGRDYMLSVDLKMKGSTDTGRWAAMSYGVVSNPSIGDNAWTFWQMAVRRNAMAGNGVECATRTTADGWSVPATGSYTESLDPNKTYNLKVVVKGKRVYEYINDRLLVRYEAQERMKYGKVAFTWDRVTAEYSNLTVTNEIPDSLDTEFPKTENGYDTDIYEPTTGLVMAPAVVSENDEKAVSELIAGKRRPSTVIRTVSENMTVTDKNEEISLADYVARLNKKTLAGFRIESMETANAFAEYVKENNLVDIMVIAKEPDILLTACSRAAGIHGMLDLGSYEGNAELIDFVNWANEANCRILVLPQKFATEENIEYIQARAIAAWVKAENSQVLNVILNGADGILTDDFENAYDVIEGFDEDNKVLTRNTVIAAHRGLHLTAPENSERAAQEAVRAGADAIECDVHLTKDGEVVVNHDETTGRLMNKDLTVADSTLAELQELTFNANAQEGDRIPTLRELFEAADEADPDDDIIHVIELKTDDPNVIDPMVKIIKDMHMEDRVIFISFHDEQLERIRKAMPNVAAGELNSVCSAADDVAAAVKKLCDRMDGYGYFYNCNYGAQSAEIVQAARFRGIYVHPWTVDSLEVYENEYFNNYHGITTNRADYAKDYLNKVAAESDTYTFAAGSSTAVAAKAYSRAGNEIEGGNMILKQISGTPVIYDPVNGTCSAKEAGEAVVLLGVTYQFAGTGKTYTVYSAPVTLNITSSDSAVVNDGLDKVIDMIESLDVSQYTSESWMAVADALKIAKTAAADQSTSQADKDAALAGLIEAFGKLEYCVQKLHLEMAIRAAEPVLAFGENYEDSNALKAVVEAGRIVLEDTDATQEETDNAAYAILDEMFKMAKKADIQSLESLIGAAKELLNNKYTSETLDNLADAIEKAEKVVADQNRADSDISNAYETLVDAITKLERKGNKAALRAMLVKAHEILMNPEAYVASTIEGLEEVLTEARTVNDDEDAVQQEIDEIVKRLTLKVADVRLVGDVDGDGAITTADCTAVLRASAELANLSGYEAAGADVNGDGVADTSDAALILQYTSEKITEF